MDSFNLATCNETENVNKIEVRFLGGQSRYGADTCNYMQVKVDDEELYAEEILTGTKFDVPCEDGEEFDSSDFDDYSYPLLKAEIIRQAEEKGIDVNRLEFYWD